MRDGPDFSRDAAAAPSDAPEFTAEVEGGLSPPSDGAGTDNFGLGPAEVVLLDRRGVIVAANGAWRAGIGALGLSQAEAGVGARYAEVAKVVVLKTDEIDFQNRLNRLFFGRSPMFEATFSQATP